MTTEANGSAALVAVPMNEHGQLEIGGGKSLAIAKRMLEELKAFVRDVLVEGVDYGTIPGTQKPCLYRAGAERLCQLYGLAPTFTADVATEDFNRSVPFFNYRITCRLVHRGSGTTVGEGLGSCNSMETKYRWRPEWWKDKNTEPPKGQGWEPVKGKWGNTWRKRVENTDTADIANTVLKMAKKRAFVDAVLTVGAVSEFFTQDLEHMEVDETVFGDRGDAPGPQQLARIADITERLAKVETKKGLDEIATEIQKESAKAMKDALRKAYAAAKKRLADAADAEAEKAKQDSHENAEDPRDSIPGMEPDEPSRQPGEEG